MPFNSHRISLPAWLPWPRRTARLRLTALYGGLFLVSGAALVAVTYVLFERATAFKKPALPQIPHIPSLQDLQTLPLPQAFSQLAKDQGQLKNVQVQLGQTVNVLPSPGHPVVKLAGPLEHSLSQLTEDQHQLAQATNHLAQAVHQLAQAGSIQAAQRATDSHELLVNSAIALGIVAVVALLAGWLVAGRMLRPIRTITHTARRISSTSLHERLALTGPQDELKELGDTLDGLFARLEDAFDAQEHFVANASHELRTPLTAERNLLQVALDDPDTSNADWRATAEEVLASNDEQAQLIDALLTLARSEGGLIEREPVDLAPLVEETLAGLQPEIRRLEIRIDDATAPALVDGDLLLVERLVVNLLTNAVRHNVDGGDMKVVTGTTADRAVLSVTNTGPVIPDAEVERLFQPFQRLDPRRAVHQDGHGLGLSIVRAIASAHRASITADPVPGGGMSVRVSFPLRKISGRSPHSDEYIAEKEFAAS
jgi:signal transduction histidine kinase